LIIEASASPIDNLQHAWSPCITQEKVKVKLRKTLIATSFGLALLIMPISAASAQQMQDMTALDGRTLGSESQATQQLFLGTWGQQATQRWAAEHDAQLRAAGFAPGEMGTSAQTGQSQGQSGAQTASGAMGQNQSDDEQEGAQSDGNLSNSHQRGGDDDDDDQNNQSGANNSDQGGVNNSSQNTGSQSGSNNSGNSGSGQGSSGSNDSGQSNSGQ
jgi:hypothetical protein